MNKEEWSDKMITKVDESLVNAKDKDVRFFRVDEFKRNIKRVGEFSTGCGFCNQQKIDVAEAVESITEAIDVPGRKRRNYDRLISRLSSHMRKEHGYYPPFYFSYLFSFYGFVSGLFAGFLMYLSSPKNSDAMFIAGFSVCLIVGYVIGSRKDSKVRLEKRLM